MSQNSEGESLYRGGIDNERLALQAQAGLDDITMRHLQELWVGPDSRVFDCGMGPAPFLGRRIMALHADYIGVDKNWAAVLPQLEAGNTAFLADIQHMPPEVGNVTHINARCFFSWMSPEERENAWDELFRVGVPALRGLNTEPDWTVVDGPSQLTELARELTDTMAVMPGARFESGYGARVAEDIDQKLRNRVGERNYFIAVSREPMPAPTPEYKREIIARAVGNVITTLRGAAANAQSEWTETQKADMTARADRLDRLFNQFLTAHINPTAIRLPDMVSVRFGVLPPRLRVGSAALRGASLAFPIAEQPPDGSVVLQMLPPWDETSLGREARRLSVEAYTLAGHFIRGSMSQEEFEQDVDPPGDRARSAQLLLVDQRARPLFGVQVELPTSESITSLQTGKKFIETYSWADLPDALKSSRVAEMKRLWGRKSRPLYMATSILAGIQIADELDVEYMLYGAVDQTVNQQLIDVFGHGVMQRIVVDDVPASVLVTGKTRPLEGTKLAVGYSRIDGFYRRVKEHLQERGDALWSQSALNPAPQSELVLARRRRDVRYLIQLCDALEARRTQRPA